MASLVLANTTTNAGTITLPPANQIQGRVITFKDSGGNFVNKALTLACSGADTFEDGTTTKTLRETYGTVQVAAISPKWFIISGTQVNTLAASTIKTAALSTTSISSATATLSSLGLVNQQGSTVSMYQASTFLYFNNFIVAGARVGVGQLFYPAAQLVTTTFTYTGADQIFTVPAGITSLTIYMWSAAGGGVTSINGAFKGGAGAYVQGTITVSSQTYTVIVGGGGAVSGASITTNAYKNGGAALNNDAAYLEGGGGGRSGLQLNGVNLIAVGAGGGAGGSGNGGAGGITSGSNGSGSSTNYGLGGTQSAGGAAGTGTYNTASPGTQYGGGNAPTTGVGGGGGDGFYGGGGGVAFGSGQQGGGGGGGSSLTSNLGSLVTAVSSNGYSAPNTASSYYQAGVATGSASSGGNGLVVITYYK